MSRENSSEEPRGCSSAMGRTGGSSTTHTVREVVVPRKEGLQGLVYRIKAGVVSVVDHKKERRPHLDDLQKRYWESGGASALLSGKGRWVLNAL